MSEFDRFDFIINNYTNGNLSDARTAIRKLTIKELLSLQYYWLTIDPTMDPKLLIIILERGIL